MKKLLTFCLLASVCTLISAQNNPSSWIGTDHSRGENLRVFRLAVSCTGEYTTSVGGVANAQANIEAWLEIINEMYGREYCVRFELIPNNTDIIYTNPATDPWPAMSGSGCDNSSNILGIQAVTIDNAIGSANYDISHVIIDPAYNGGCAGGYKTGYSGGLGFSITRHEMGHQFGQPHTISNGGNNNYELSGAGWSVQGGNSYPYAHATSYHELVDKIENDYPGIGSNIATGNTVPTVDAGPDLAIPISTPFTLTGTASDPDPGDHLTYIWDCMDGGLDQGLPITDQTQGALFMRLLPSADVNRTVPDIEDIVNNLSSTDNAHLCSVPREMNVKLTVNDNHKMNIGGQMVNVSGISADDKKITIVNNGGPFLVISPNTAVTFAGGSSTLVTWAVNGTNLAPINTTNVKISLSLDGGISYNYVLSSSTLNDGSHTVTLPDIGTTQGRIKVEAVGNIFFDISDANFTITSACQVASSRICPTNNVSYDVGDPGLNMNFIVASSSTVESYQFDVMAADPDMNKVRWDSTQSFCETPGGTTNYQQFSFVLDEPGNYGIDLGTFRSAHLFTDAFDPNGGCSGFLGSSRKDVYYYGQLVGLPPLSDCTIYHLIANDEGFGGNTLATISGPSKMRPLLTIQPNTAYTYVAVNSLNDEVALVSNSADFTTLPAGNYQIYGANYYAGGGPTPPIVNPALWVGQTLQDIYSSADCVIFSSNHRKVEVTPDCPGNLPVSGTITTGLYQASVSLIATGTIPSGNNVMFRAGNDINLNGDFSVLLGSELNATIGGCN